KENAATVGFKNFIRYDVFDWFYLHAESTHHFSGISDFMVNSEKQRVENYQANLALGLGGTKNLSKSLKLNFQVLYQAVTSDYVPNQSPLIFRGGVKF
ncbi:MAG: hypothetical protein AAFO69_19985, partial [Bacteroidota bacterium]